MDENSIVKYGCKHYKRNCHIIASCCNKSYACKACHDEFEKHLLEPVNIKKMVCQFCKIPQRISEICHTCNVRMGEYYCKKCKFWSNEKCNYFHCDLCGLCRVGKRCAYFHCLTCNACLENTSYKGHRHVENTLKSDCPICAEFLFTSHKDVIMLPCGHAIHEDCLGFYRDKSTQCPICMKSIGCTKEYNESVENLLRLINDAPRCKGIKMCGISCYDCGQSTETLYRYLFNRCKSCNSFNTRLNEICKNKQPNRRIKRN